VLLPVSGAFTAFSAAMIANPITALILLVSAAAAAYFYWMMELVSS
jgi:hypothetical protein